MLLHQRLTFYGTGPVTLQQNEDYWLAYLAVGPGVSVEYAIADYDGVQFEQGTGVFAAGGGVFIRVTATRSSNGNNLVAFENRKRSVAILARPAGGGVIAPTKQLGTGSQSGTVPTGATKVRVTGIAAGGNGGGTGAAGGGGGSGEWVDDFVLPVTAGDAWSLSVGAVASNTTFTLNGVVYTLRCGANGTTGNLGGAGGGAGGGFGLGGDDAGAVSPTLGYRAPPWHGGTGGGSANAGGGGRPTFGPNVGASAASTNNGAGSPWGKGGDGRSGAGAGNAATGYGAGGSGGLTGGAGGAGAPGFLILAWEA